MPDTVRLDEQFYIVAEAERSPAATRVLKEGDSFSVFDPHGDMVPREAGEHGLFYGGTRFLSRWELLFGLRRPLLLSSTISEDNLIFTADLTNTDVLRDGQIVVPRGEIHVFRSRALCEHGFSERIRIGNHALQRIELPIVMHLEADYADVFEVRGTRRARRGRQSVTHIGQESSLGYVGLDGVERRTTVRFSRLPDRVDPGSVTFLISLAPHESIELDSTVACSIGAESNTAPSYADVVARAKLGRRENNDRECLITSSNETFNRWIRRSSADLRMMMTETDHGRYPYAGIPWFSTPFGRDGIITAMELLWMTPAVARGVLLFLADTQATADSDAQDSQPGKILHEMRSGEMAALGEVPFGCYYGSADATPLFVMLASAYFDRTGDRALIDRLWPHILAALDWMVASGDIDGDGFIEYARRSDTGLVQQGWKDSHDSVFHADGSLAEPPIALCEIQGYAYAAWRGAARLASERGDAEVAGKWHARADAFQHAFEATFWCEEIGTYALALDGSKRPCRVRTSNPGHCLFSGIASPERARLVANTLMSDASFAGWGVRTLASGEARYNPMSYHNGSIWPHDNALVAAGLARYGFGAAALRVMNAMFDLSAVVDLHRLPELICGFHRREGESPTLYPVACAPQAWSAGAAHMLLAACLGLRIDAAAHRISFTRPTLPDGVEWLRLSKIVVGEATADVLLTRHAHDVSVTVLAREGEFELVSIK